MILIHRKWLAALTISSLAAAAIAGCGSKSDTASPSGAAPGTGGTDPKIELRFIWWGSQDRHDRTLKVVRLFEEKHPNVKISTEFTGGDQIFQRLATQAAGNDLPDIVQMDLPILAEYAQKNLIRPLDEYVGSGTINLQDVDANYVDGGKINGKLYALSIGTTAIAMVVDPEMYKRAGVPIPEPGYTWDDFIGQARQLKEKLGKDVYVRAMSGPAEFRQIYLNQLGQSFYNEGFTGLGYDDKYLADFFTMWKQLIDKGITPGPAVTAAIQGLEDEMIVHGKSPNHAAQQPRVAFNSNQFVALSKAANRSLDMVIYPNFPNGQKGQYLKPSQFLSIATGSKHPDMAARFIDFFTNSLEANEILGAERGVPISSKVREHLYSTMNEAGKKTFDYVENVSRYSAGQPVSPPGDAAVLSIFDKTYEAMAFGKLTPAQAAAQFRQEAEAVLVRNKK